MSLYQFIFLFTICLFSCYRTDNVTVSTPTTAFNYIDCNGDDKCSSDSKICIDNVDCIIDCIGNNACQQANILCPLNAHCQLNCGGISDDCKSLDIDAKGSISLDITCGDGAESCDRMNVYCPINNTQCNISGLNGNNVDSVIHLYSVQGLHGMNISDDRGSSSASTVVAIHILCTEDYSKECYITGTNIFNACIDGDEICNNYNIGTEIISYEPTNNFLVSPRPTQRPSIKPAVSNSNGNISSLEFVTDTEDLMILIIVGLVTIILILICCATSCMKCVAMKCNGFYMIYMVILRIIDVSTDILLSYNIIIYTKIHGFNSNIWMFIAFGSVICLIIPYTINMVSIYWIYNLPKDTSTSIQPKLWLKKCMMPFILLYLITNDAYLLIELFSSGLCGSDIFDSGHTIIEKEQIKIFKILSIITGNVPQIIIQGLFGWIIYTENRLNQIILFLLVLSMISSLFVIITFIRLSMRNRKIKKKKHNLISYGLRIKLMRSTQNYKYDKKHEIYQIKKYRSSKRKIREKFALILGIKKHELQIGHIDLKNDGCIINLVQRIPSTRNDYEYIENIYKNKPFAEIIEDIFHLEWDIAVKLVIHKTTEINKQITLEHVELAIQYQREYNKANKQQIVDNNNNNNNDDDDDDDDCFNDNELNDIYNTIQQNQNGHTHGESLYAMPSTDVVTPIANNIEIANKSQDMIENEIQAQSVPYQYINHAVNDINDINDSKPYQLDIIPSAQSVSQSNNKETSEPIINSDAVKQSAEYHYNQLFKEQHNNNINNNINNNNEYNGNINQYYNNNNIGYAEYVEYREYNEYNVYNEYEENKDEGIDESETHASGDCALFSPQTSEVQTGSNIKYFHPGDTQFVSNTDNNNNNNNNNDNDNDNDNDNNNIHYRQNSKYTVYAKQRIKDNYNQNGARILPTNFDQIVT